MLLTILIAVAAGVSAGLGWGGWRGRGGAALLAGATVSLTLLMLQAAGSIASMLEDPWNFIRLAPSLTLLNGDPLYPGAGRGPILGWIYGPVLPWLNLPALLLPGPVPAVLAAGILNEVLLLAPLFLLCRVDTPRGRLEGFLLLGAVHAGMLLLPASRMWLRNIHADSPALSFGLLGLVMLLRSAPGAPLTRGRLAASAAFLVLGAFGKQVEVAVVAAAALYVGLRDGRGPGVRFAMGVGAGGAGLGLLCLAGFGADGFLLNMVRIPASHPWDGNPGLWTWELFLDSLVPLGLLGGLALVEGVGRSPGPVRERLLRASWFVPVLGALAMLPLSVIGRSKLGASDSANHCVYYLVAAIVPPLAACMAGRPVLVGAAAILVALAFSAPDAGKLGSVGASFSDSRLERELRFALERKDQVWFLDNPLVTAYSDGRLYDQGYGVYDRRLAGMEAEPGDPRRPRNLRWVSTPGPPFWQPEGFERAAAPPGLDRTYWYAPR